MSKKPTTRPKHGLKPEHETFAKEYATNGGNGVRAALVAARKHGREITYGSAEVKASRLLSDNRILDRVRNIDNELEDTMLDVMRANAKKRLAFDVASYIHDKRHGKATQKTENTTTHVSIALDLSGN
jgi:phage terminase small subunit